MKELLVFDKGKVEESLADLPTLSRLAFGLACAERLFENAARNLSSDEETELRRILDEAWGYASNGGQSSIDHWKKAVERCESLLSSSDSEESLEESYRNDLLAAMIFSLRSLWSENFQELLGWASERSYTQADHLASLALDESAEPATTLALSPVQRELHSQREDLADLGQESPNIATLAERAQANRLVLPSKVSS